MFVVTGDALRVCFSELILKLRFSAQAWDIQYLSKHVVQENGLEVDVNSTSFFYGQKHAKSMPMSPNRTKTIPNSSNSA